MRYKIPKKFKKMVEYIEWENLDEHYWVELNDGWVLDDAHCFGEDTWDLVLETLGRVEPE